RDDQLRGRRRDSLEAVCLTDGRWLRSATRHGAFPAGDGTDAFATVGTVWLERNARTVRGKAVVSVGEGSPQRTLPRRAWAS
ncbi:MAG TPA: hypothetical protein VFZ89_11785, partial [Solirubrobacteraceae bacterium]